ncbi:MAG: hypothetical protein HY021_01725 [Burkholderiales bacterium]|nr:hypothetical protein [Burkholderiales bacterium]
MAGERSMIMSGVFTAAAVSWESLLRDNRTFNITVGWASLPLGVVAAAATVGDRTNEIALSTRLTHFADPTPSENEEFGAFEEVFADLGGGVINTGRGFAFGGLPALDLLTVAMHEMGHVLGNILDGPVFGGSSYPIVGGPFDGTELPCASSGGLCVHLNLADALMSPFGGLDHFERTLISGADLLYIAADGRFTDVDLSSVGPHDTPEPPLPALAVAALLALAWRRRQVLARSGLTAPARST